MKKNSMIKHAGIILLFSFLGFRAHSQNVGVNTDAPTNTLHVKTLSTGEDPLRLETLQSAMVGDTAVLVCDPVTGIVRQMPLDELFNSLGEWVFDPVSNYIYARRAKTEGFDIVVTNDGKLGINTSTPSEALEVGGNIELDNYLIMNDKEALRGSDSWLRLNQSNEFATGVYTPSYFRVDNRVTFNETGGAFDFRVEGDNDTHLLFTDGSADEVGIGTSNPQAKLDVNGKTKTTNFQMTNGANNGYIMQSDAVGNGSWVDINTVFTDTDDQQITNFSINASNILRITLEDGGTQTVDLTPYLDNTDDQQVNVFSINPVSNILTIAVEDGGSRTVDLTPYLDNTDDQQITDFSLNNSTNVLSITLEDGGTRTVNLNSLIDHDWYEVGTTSPPNSINDDIFTQGNVGIGTTTPSERLHVQGNQYLSGALQKYISGVSASSWRVVNNDGAGNFSIYLNSTSGTSPKYESDGPAFRNYLQTISNNDNTNRYRFMYATPGTAGSAITWNDGWTLNPSNGYFGIGTSNPLANLDVNGKTRTTNFQMTSGAQNNYIMQSDAAGNGSWVDINTVFTDTDDQQITNFSINASNILRITLEDGGTQTVDLTPYLDNTDDQQVNVFSINPVNNVLTIAVEDGGSRTVDLTPYLDNTDDQQITDFSLNNSTNVLSITLEAGGTRTVNLNSLIDHDWYEVGTTSPPNDINDAIYTQGRVGIGINNPSTQNLLTVNGTASQNGTTSRGAFFSMWNDETNDVTNNFALNGISYLNNAGNVATMEGIRSQIQLNTAASGTITNARLLYAAGGVQGGTTSASVNNLFGLQINLGALNDVSTNAYGLYVNNVGGASGNNFAIYTNSGSIRFGGLSDNLDLANKLVVQDGSGVLHTLPTSTIFGEGEWQYNTLGDYIYARRAFAGGNDVVVSSTGEVGIGTTTPVEALDVEGNIELNDYLSMNGKQALRGSDSWLRLNQNNQFTNGIYTPSFFRVDNAATFNEGGADFDFRVEGDTDANLLFADGSTDRIGIGLNNPAAKLDINGKTKTTNFQMTNGATNGYIMRSDAVGNGLWVDINTVFTDTDDQQITNFSINASNTLRITLEDGGTQTVDLTPYLDNTDDQQVNVFSINPVSNILTIAVEDGGSRNVDLTPYLDNTDDQQITDFSLNNSTNVLSITLEDGGTRTVNLNSLIDHDWYEVGTTSPPNNINDDIFTQGNVGIGTNSPSERLHVQGNQYLSGSFQKYISGNSPSSWRMVNNDGTGNFNIYLNSTSGVGPTYESDGPAFRTLLQQIGTNNNLNRYRFMYATPSTAGSAITWNDGWTLNPSNGYFGINTSNPLANLDVNGTTRTTNFQMTNGAQNNYIMQSDALGNGSWVDINTVFTDTDDQQITNFSINASNILRITLEDGGTQTVDLTPYLDNTDDQQITDFSLNNSTNVLSITLEDGGTRTVNLNSLIDHDWYEVGTTSPPNSINDDIFTQGRVGIGTDNPSVTLEAVNNSNSNGFRFTQAGGTTGEKDIFVIEDMDAGGSGQDHSSTLKVLRSGNIDPASLGHSLVELTYTGTDPSSGAYYITGRKTDEGAPTWGVDIADNDIWSSGGMVLNVDTLASGNYSGGNFIVEKDGDVGIGTTSPEAKLHVNGGDIEITDATPTIKFEDTDHTDYWIHNNAGRLYFLWDEDDNGTWGGENPWPLYFDGRSSYFDGSQLVVDAVNDRVGIGTGAPSEKLDVNGKTKTTQFQMTSGAQNNYIMQSDAVGNGSWVNANTVFTDTDTDQQTLGISGQNLSISNGNTVILPDSDNQTLSLNNLDLSISNGNTVTLSNLIDHDWYEVGTNTPPNNINDNIFTQGRVGIGTDSPTQTLDVEGVARIGDRLNVGPDAGNGGNTQMRLGKNFSDDQSTYQLYSNNIITSPTLSADRTSYGAFFQLYNNKTEDLAGGFDSDAVAGYFMANISGTSTFRSMYGIQGFADNNSDAASDLGNLYGGYFRAMNNSQTAIVPNSYGILAQARGRGTAGGDMTNAFGVRGETFGYANNITNAYGLYGYTFTPNGHAGDITNAYGVYGRVRVDSDAGGDITTGRAGYFLTDRRAGANLMTTAYGIQVDANSAQTVYGIQVDVDDINATTNYALHINAQNATADNIGIWGENGDWVLDANGNGAAGGTANGGDLILGESQEMALFFDGTDAQIRNSTGNLLLQPASNVGIGTNAPSEKLHVNGNAYITSQLRVSSGQTVGRINADGADDIPGLHLIGEDNIWFDAGQVRITTHDGTGNWQIKSGADNDDVKIGNGGGAVKMRIDENGSWQLYSQDGLTNGDNISWNLGLYQNGTGRVGIGTNNPATELQVIGNIFATGNASDRRFKKNIEPFAKSALDEIDKIETVTYEYRTDEFAEEHFPAGIQTGFIAQDLEAIVPEAVFDREDGYKGVDYGKVTPLLVQAVKELKAEVETLQTENEALKQKIASQQAVEVRLEALTKQVELLMAQDQQNTTEKATAITKTSK